MLFRSFSSLNKHQLPPVGSPRNSNASAWGNVGSPMGKADWGFDGEEQHRLRRREPPGFAEKELDVSWGPSPNSRRGEMPGRAGGIASGSTKPDLLDHQTVTGAWFEQLHTDQK